MDPIARVMIDHWRCMGSVPEAYRTPDMIKIVESNPLPWGESTGWALHLRRAFPMLTQTLSRATRIFPKIDPDVRYDADEHTYTFRSGYRYQFGHCLNRDDWEKYDSSQYDWIGYDELVQFEKDQYDNINTRLRSVDPVHRQHLKIRSMSNPVRKQEYNISIDGDPQWVRKRFVDPAPEGGVTIRHKLVNDRGETINADRIFMRATLADNPDPVFRKQYEETLLDKPAHIRQAMLYGNWYVTPGAFFGDDWNPKLHVVKPFRIPSDWPRFRMLDWGFKTHGCVLWGALDFDDNLYVEREFSFRGMTAKEVAKHIKRIEEESGLWAGGHSAITGPADTSLWEERNGTGKSMAEEMADMGITWTMADKRSRQQNAWRVISRLKDHKNGTRPPGLMFFENCKQCIKTIPSIQADHNNSEEPIKGGEDHWYDALSYGCAFASHGQAGIPRKRKSGDDMHFHRKVGETTDGKRSVGYGVRR
jgi:hypothetical protein